VAAGAEIVESDPEPDVVWSRRADVESRGAVRVGERIDQRPGVPSGGFGVSQSPSVAVSREISRKAPRQPGSRHELDIIDPFHSSKIRVWQLSQAPGLFTPFQSAS
jgi:hypothetical protein